MNLDILVVRPLRDATRSLMRSRGFTATAVLSVAGAVCLACSVYAVVATIFFSTPPYRDPGTLVELWQTAGPGSTQPQDYLAPVRMEEWVEGNEFRSLQGVAATGMGTKLVLRGSDGGVRVNAAPVLGDWFGTLGVQPEWGRVLTLEDLQPGAPPVVVVSEPFWRDYLSGGEPGTVVLSGATYSVVGVMPLSFATTPIVWVPKSSLPEGLSPGAYAGIGRLRDGMSMEQAIAEVEHLAAVQVQEDSATYAGLGATARLIGQQARSAERPALWMLAGVVLAVVLVALNNLAVLTLVRAQARGTSLAVRASLGASRWELGRGLATEGALIGLAGAALGLTLAIFGKDAAAAYLARGMGHPALTLGTAGVALALGSLVAIVIGLEPLHRIGNLELRELLQRRSGGASSTPGERRGRQAFLAAQIATCVVLLAVASVLAAAHAKFGSLDVGYDARQVVEIFPDWQVEGASTEEQWRVAGLLVQQLKSLPEASATTAWSQIGEDFPPRPEYDAVTDGPTVERGTFDRLYRYYEVLPGFFETLGLELVQGRPFTGKDGAGAPPVAVVTERAAQLWWPGTPAVGRQVKLGRAGVWMTVVGVVKDLQQPDELGRMVATGSRPPMPLLFVPHGQFETTPVGWRPFDCCAGVRVGVRAAGSPGATIRAARQVLAHEAPDLPIISVRSLYDVQMRGHVGRSLAATGWLVLVGMSVALLLAVVGIVGVVSEAVSRRRREIGLRIALGAGSAQVSWAIGKETVLATLLGLTAGLAVLWTMQTWFSKIVFDWYVQWLAPEVLSVPVLAIASTVVLLTAMAAVMVTSRKALRVDPIEVLRTD